MIAAGLVLLAVGVADLVREFVPARRRWIGFLAGAAGIVLLGVLADAVIPALLALAVTTTWVWLSPSGATTRAGMWPIAGLGIISVVLTFIVPVRAGAGLLGQLGPVVSPVGALTIDHLVLLLGAGVYLLESANVVVRTALAHERVEVKAVSADAADPAFAEDDEVAAQTTQAEPSGPEGGTPAIAPALKGGRLIGPLERLLVLGLTLAGMWPLAAGILAAKGIVRFPEISRDSAEGNRAEYFLIGSLVSWTQALAAALLIWWSFATTLP